MELLNVLKTLGAAEWIFWIVVTFVSVKGYIEYPNVIKNNLKKYNKVYSGKPSLQA